MTPLAGILVSGYLLLVSGYPLLAENFRLPDSQCLVAQPAGIIRLFAVVALEAHGHGWSILARRAFPMNQSIVAESAADPHIPMLLVRNL